MVGGKHLARSAMVAVLKQGATDLGQPEEDYATHSLRIGGATTMVNEGVAVETVRRHGRWMSIDMWRRYAHTTNDLMKGVSSVMARAKYTVAQASRDFRTRLL
jgi:site-specific recombinase XerD